MAVKVDLLLIDLQNDFVDAPGKPGSLPVGGAYQDCKRVAGFINRVGVKLHDIHATMDTHRTMDVAHPGWWRNLSNGDHPTPGTEIKPSDIGTLWTTSVPQYLQRAKSYAEALYKNGRYPLLIWPEHCKIGTWGNNIQDDVAAELANWERRLCADVDYVMKGTNPFTEHYSAVQAEVPEANDPTTQLNDRLIRILMGCDQIAIAGEASSHCVANTVRDIAREFGAANAKKLVLLRDCMSPVVIPNVIDFTPQADAFFKDMQALGVRVVNSADYMI
jgi:nicotinamidase/pyrazinamidase